MAENIDRTTVLKVSGLTCSNCVRHASGELEEVEGVKNVSVILNKGGVSDVMVVSDVHLDDQALADAVDEAGNYTLEAIERDE